MNRVVLGLVIALSILFVANLAGFMPAVVRARFVDLWLPLGSQTVTSTTLEVPTADKKDLTPPPKATAPVSQTINVHPPVPTPPAPSISQTINVYPPAPTPAPVVPAPAPEKKSLSWSIGPASPMSARKIVTINGLDFLWEAGGLKCLREDNPDYTTDGFEASVVRPDGRTYFTWAPQCNRRHKNKEE